MTKKQTIRAALFVPLAAAILTAAAGCKFLQQGLGSTMKEEQAEQTGGAALNGSSWHYMGHSGSDMTDAKDHNVCIEFGKRSAASASGISVSFDVTYTNKNGNRVTESVPEAGGRFARNNTAYYADMSNVLSLFDGASVKDGTAVVKMTASGFVCAEGEQAGRALDKVEKEFSVKPLFAFDPDAKHIDFSTTESTAGKSISIPVNCELDLSGADVTITAVSGDLPEGLSGSKCALEYDEASGAVLVKPGLDMEATNATFRLEITGTRPLLHGTTKDICVYVNATADTVISTDSWSEVAAETVVYDISSLSVTDDGTNLIVSVRFNGNVCLWENDRIGILVANPLEEKSVTAGGSWNGLANTVTATGADYYFEKITKENATGFTVSGTWEQNTDDYAYRNGSDSVVFTIPLSAIGTPTSGTELTIFAAVSTYWYESSGIVAIKDLIPMSAGTTSKTSKDNDTLTVDMSKALAYTVK